MRTRKRNDGLVRRSFVLAGFVWASAWAASATSIDFIIDPVPTTSGQIGYAGGDAPLIGFDIEVDAIQGNGTPVNSGLARACIECALTFITGPFLGGDSSGWVFEPTGTNSQVSLTGGIDLDGDGDANDPGDIATGTLLLFGQFLGNPVTVDANPATGLVDGVVLGLFADFKDPAITGFYGLPFTGFEGFISLGFTGQGDAPGAFLSDRIGEGLITNTPVPTPEPSVLSLLGIGLVGLTARVPFRRKKVGHLSNQQRH